MQNVTETRITATEIRNSREAYLTPRSTFNCPTLAEYRDLLISMDWFYFYASGDFYYNGQRDMMKAKNIALNCSENHKALFKSFKKAAVEQTAPPALRELFTEQVSHE